MKFINEDFAYYIDPNNNTESIIGLKKYFSSCINDNLDDFRDSSKFPTTKIIGNLMFEILQNKKLEYDQKTNEHIKYFNFYLEKCIENQEFCNNKVFLACMQKCISLVLPKKDLILENIYTIEQRKNYNIIHSNFEKKTSIIYDNRNNINYAILYYCKNIEDLFICSLYELFERKYHIRKCKNCNRFFVTKESGNRIKYCYNDSPQDSQKSCYQYVSQSKSKEARKKDYNIRLYGQITSKLRNRMDRATDKEMQTYYYNELTKLSETCRDIRTNIRKGIQTYNDLTDFLNNYNEQDKKRKEKIKNGSSRTNKK